MRIIIIVAILKNLKEKSFCLLYLSDNLYCFVSVSVQAQPVDPDLTAKLLGRGVAVSPIVTVEPRRRKFHKAITLSMPAPKAHSQGMINQYSGNTPTLRLLCSITGKFYMLLVSFAVVVICWFTSTKLLFFNFVLI